ncbi:MAG: DUF1015 family protein [Firmicutes bacterium]|nr:DUF1015 family protein [Bacillota bacterium]
MTSFNEIGIAVPQMLFPAEGTDLTKWATIACDQFTAQPEYWEEVRRIVGLAPSTLNMQMPEAWLPLKQFDDLSGAEARTHEAAIPHMMKRYLEDGTLTELPEGFMFVKRQTTTGIRRGLLVLFDLERYEYAPGNKALMRATEGTVESRLPVRVEIRKKAPLEMPHAMVLVSDPKDILMGSLEILTRNRQPLYSFDLMQNSGNIKGFLLSEPRDWNIVAGLLAQLKSSAPDGMLFAVGDGNHSLAAAKKIWEEEKARCAAQQTDDPNQPTPDLRKRYVLAELVNLYDPALAFEPIHRLVRDGKVVDYIHGEEECVALARKYGCAADIRPPYPKSRLFTDVIENGVLPKKTFSMGHAADKRFYLECRRI